MRKILAIYVDSSSSRIQTFLSFCIGLIMGSGVFFYPAEHIWQNCSSALTALMSSGVTCLILFEFKSRVCNEMQIYSHSLFMCQNDPPLKVHKIPLLSEKLLLDNKGMHVIANVSSSDSIKGFAWRTLRTSYVTHLSLWNCVKVACHSRD